MDPVLCYVMEGQQRDTISDHGAVINANPVSLGHQSLWLWAGRRCSATLRLQNTPGLLFRTFTQSCSFRFFQISRVDCFDSVFRSMRAILCGTTHQGPLSHLFLSSSLALSFVFRIVCCMRHASVDSDHFARIRFN